MKQKLRQILTTWAAVYPIITGLLLILEPLLRAWPTPARTLLLSAIMVPLMVLWAVPAMNQLAAAVTSTGRRPESTSASDRAKHAGEA